MALTMSSFVLLMGMYPEIQEKVFEELRSVLPSKDEDLTDNKLNKLEYLDLTVKETLRFMTVVPYIARYLTTETKIGNLNKNRFTFINFYLSKALTRCRLDPPLVFRSEKSTVTKPFGVMMQTSLSLRDFYQKISRIFIPTATCRFPVAREIVLVIRTG